VKVILPDANGEVFLNGSSLGTGTRTFEFPNMNSAKYTVKITAAWNRDGQRMSEDRLVDVVAGKETVVDFTKSTSARSTMPPVPDEENP